MTEKVAQHEELLYPEPLTPAHTPVAQRLYLSRLSTLPDPSCPIRWLKYSEGFFLYKLHVKQKNKKRVGVIVTGATESGPKRRMGGGRNNQEFACGKSHDRRYRDWGEKTLELREGTVFIS